MTNAAVSTTLNNLPQELLDAVIDLVPQCVQLKECALVGKHWVRRCQERLFERFTLSLQRMVQGVAGYGESTLVVFVFQDVDSVGGCTEPYWVHTLKLISSLVDLDGEVIPSSWTSTLQRTNRGHEFSHYTPISTATCGPRLVLRTLIQFIESWGLSLPPERRVELQSFRTTL